MRIQKLRFQNLNSLEGEWEIDFTNTSFVNNGIFAIIGPTGAGKSTILDAICLALYAETPRLKRVNQSGNDIMSRKTASCFAEVQFETSQGSYLCYWSQKKARNKVDGKLQNPSHEIALVAEEITIIASTLVTVKDKVEEVTGMDFKRFTRSMLLAQGGFDVFLKADINERASILEQITGTDIYSKISVEVFLRKNKERETLNRMQELVNAYALLSLDEVIEMQSKLTELGKQELSIRKDLSTCISLISWKENIERLNQEITENTVSLGLVEEQIVDFAANQQILDKAHQAQFFLPVYRILESQSKQLTALKTDQLGYQAQKETIEAAIQTVSKDWSQQQDLIDQAELQDKQKQELYNKVRELDIQIREQTTTVKALIEEKRPLDLACQQIASDIVDIQTNISRSELELNTINHYMKERSNDASLVESLQGYEIQLNQLQVLTKELIDTQVKQNACDSVAQKKILQETTTEAKQSEDELNELKSTIASLETARKGILADKDIYHYRKALQDINATGSKLSDLKNLIQSQNTYQSSLDLLQKSIDETNAQVKLFNEEIATLKGNISATEQIQTEERDKYDISLKIISLDSERKLLKENEACPLCGAIHHPFADTNLPEINEFEQTLKALETRLKALQKELNTKESKCIEALTKLKIYTQQLEETTVKCVATQNNISSLSIELSIKTIELSEDKVEAMISDNVLELHRIDTLISQIDELTIKISNEQQAYSKGQKTLADLQQKKLKLQHDIQIIQADYDRYFASVNQLHDTIFESKRVLLQKLKPYNVELADLDKAQPLITKLKNARDEWLTHKASESLLTSELVTLNNSLLSQKSLEKERKKLQEELGDKLIVAEKQLNTWNVLRHDLFEGNDVSTEQDLWQKYLSDQKSRLNDLLVAKEKQKADLIGIEKNISKIEEQISAVSGKYQNEMQKFENSISQVGFSTIQNYEEAILSQEAFEELSQKAEKLRTAKSNHQSIIKDKSDARVAELDKQLTEKDISILKKEYESHMNTMKEVTQEIGSIDAVMKEDQKKKAAQAEQLLLVQAQNRELLRWEKLSELIGSADGKKYRGFVQGITFEMLIAHANVQLQKLSDRYLLINSECDPLELNIIDNYQGGEIRTIKNLSGGESFIVSLSLALGLSAMSSQKVRIDSLFLDEGFGSLDEDSLEIALENLAALNNEGKLIGIISHVPAIKERITNQIQVIPQAGGVSTITGIGCRYLSTAD